MLTIPVGYKSGSGNIMSLTVYGKLFDRNDIPLDEPGRYCNHNGIDCGGYNGGCPPYAPRFDKVKPSLSYFYVICVEFDMAWAYLYAGKPTPYFMLSYADRLTMFYIQRAVQYFENNGFYALGASNCPGCSPKNCTVTRGGKCSNPKKRRFSLEATGVECHTLHKKLFNENLPWWYRTVDLIPAFMYRYAGVFVSQSGGNDSYLQCFADLDKSRCETIPVHGYDWELSNIPEGKDDSGHYKIYRLENFE